jgi:hypothetical protein
LCCFVSSANENIHFYFLTEKIVAYPIFYKRLRSQEGVTAFWKGIGAAWMREASYTSLRLGLYGPIKHAMGVTSKSPFLMKFAAGSLAGAIGSTVGNPFDVLKTRMMTSEGKYVL